MDIGKETQKQPFADVLQNRCSLKFHNIYRKSPVLESLFNKVAGLQENLGWRKSNHELSLVSQNHSCF